MGYYRDEINVVPHNFNTSTLTINNDFVVEGLEMMECERDEDEVTTQAVASGMAQFVESPITKGVIRFQFLESSPSTDKMWEMYENKARFAISFLDSNAPNLNCGGKKFRISKPPVVKRGKEGDVVEWVCPAPYLKTKGGSYRLEAE